MICVEYDLVKLPPFFYAWLKWDELGDISFP